MTADTPSLTTNEVTDSLRVEDLAEASGLSIDTIRFYQKRHLIPAPKRRGRVAWYSSEHITRINRIRELQESGLSLALIRRLLDGELNPADAPLAVAVAFEVGGELITRAELARRTGVPDEILVTIANQGLLRPQIKDGVEYFSAHDVSVITAGVRLLDAGLPFSALLSLAQRQHEMTRAVAVDAVEMFDQYVRSPLQEKDLSDDERAQALVAAFELLLPTVTALVAQHFRDVLLEVAQDHLEAVGESAELSSPYNSNSDRGVLK